MRTISTLRPVTSISYLLALAVAISSAGGVFLPETYAKETPSWAAQGLGQDVVNLVLVVPFLLVSNFFTRKGSRVFLFCLGGIFIYSVYSYLLYAFCVHFNRLFFAYCAALGLSVYALVLLGMELRREKAETWFDRGKPTALPALFFLVTTVAFYFLWLAEDVPAVLSGTAPKSLQEAGLFTNPVHVLDLSIILPAMLIASQQLLRRKPFGYVFFPIMMVFAIVMGVAIGGMMLAMSLKGLMGDKTVICVFGVLVFLDSAALAYFLRSLKPKF